MWAIITGLGSLLLRIWGVFRSSQLLKLVFYKGILLSFALVILPKVITIALFRFNESLLPIILEKLNPYISSITGNSTALNLIGFGAWAAQEMNLVDSVSVLISGVFTMICLKILLKSFS